MRKPGYVRLGNKRAGAPGKPDAGETAIDIDRRNPVLGNPFVCTTIVTIKRAMAVIEHYRAKYARTMLRRGGDCGARRARS